MDIYEKIDLDICPYCGGPGVLEEENGWCWYVTCADCGTHTVEVEYRKPEKREEAAESAAHLWNIGKVISAGVGE